VEINPTVHTSYVRGLQSVRKSRTSFALSRIPDTVYFSFILINVPKLNYKQCA